MAGAGYRDWAAGNVPTATQFDTYLQEQTVMVFATAAARDSALSTAKSEGMFTYQLDSNTYTIYDGAAWLPFMIGWAAFTPVVGGAGWALGNGTITGRYNQLGKTVTAQMKLVAGSTTTFGGSQLTMTVPVTAATGGPRQLGRTFIVNDAGGLYGSTCVVTSSTVISFYTNSGVSGLVSLVQTDPFTFGNLDTFEANITYEAA